MLCVCCYIRSLLYKKCTKTHRLQNKAQILTILIYSIILVSMKLYYNPANYFCNYCYYNFFDRGGLGYNTAGKYKNANLLTKARNGNRENNPKLYIFCKGIQSITNLLTFAISQLTKSIYNNTLQILNTTTLQFWQNCL